ncbi:FAD-dependent oxidoreductase [Virgibacillus sp. C22-A2]|uniref:FAD-dependent oxidoreductase n=1 Tax=Virgibacillus tibetensis TaxID=3042313 RepID=A0ABU6KB21_9BACI|nr:FAD-dependent oxidoreductase [Virgibacillus sp. C22-A2]
MTDIQLPQFPEPFWRDSVSLPSFPKLEQSINVDVGIVGGGITGITAAYLLSKQNVNVTLIDAGVILNGTTGHTTAKITAQHGLIYDELIQHFGQDKASQYYQAADDAQKLIQETISSLAIDCDFQKEDAYIYTNSDSYISQLENEKKAYDKLNIQSQLTETIPLDIPLKSALIMKDQAQFHPLRYLKVLVEESAKNGVQFFENTTATDIEHNKHPAIITRDGNRISCDNIIIATQFPFYDKEGFYFARMYQDRSYVLAVKSPKTFPGGMYINAETPTRSIRTTSMNGEDLWLIGGENHKTGTGQSTIEHYNALHSFAAEYVGIDQIPYRWSAQDITTLDKVPYIGPITDNNDAIFVATGYRKWGMTNGTVAAKVISDRITQKENQYEDLYSPSRFQADPSIRKFASINADVAKHLIKGKLEYTENNINKLAADDATVTRIGGKRAGVYKDEGESLHMVDTTCTHMGCEVEWNSGDRTWDCPCHGSRFSYTGEVVTGPATKPLSKIDPE